MKYNENVVYKQLVHLGDELSNSGFATDKGRQYFLNTLEFVTQASEKMGIADYLEEEKKQIAQKVKIKP